MLTSGAVHYGGPGYMHSVLRAVRPTPHPHLALRNAALRGAAFSVAGLAVEAIGRHATGEIGWSGALTRRTAVQVVGGEGVAVAIVKTRGHEGAVPFCDVHVTLCDVDGGGVDV